MDLTRRRFLYGAAGVTAGFFGLRHLLSGPTPGHSNRYGRLVAEPTGTFLLPTGFSCTVFSATGETMDDGFLVPGAHDGMATFPGPDGRTILIRNHELLARDVSKGPFGRKNELLSRIDPRKLYDFGRGEAPGLGGTTTLVFDTGRQRLERHFLSLAGTLRNCAGGPTPWGSWISCEETVQTAFGRFERDHGYVFEVPASAEIGAADPVPLLALGRFNHEAVAVDPKSYGVYLTEDQPDGLLYRFLPRTPGELARGGRLQALAVGGRPGLYTANRGRTRVARGEPLSVEWVDLDDVQSPRDDLRARGRAKGAAAFSRGEGIWTGKDGLYFCATDGGERRKGQVWRLVPDADRLELFIEPEDATVLENCDNLTVAPWGDLVLCEDGPGWQNLVGVSPAGEPYLLAQNVRSPSELAGACFSPDGTTLFVNLQRPGLTAAITGPWRTS
jgi:secreted PhoX family phosphatase